MALKRPFIRKLWPHLFWLLPFGGLFLLLACNAYIRWSVERDVFSEIRRVPARPVALVLGTARRVNGRPNRFYTARIRAAAELFRAGKIRHVLVSGDNSHRDYDEPTAMKRDLVASGVPGERITIDYAGFRTLDSVVRAHRVFGQRSFVVVSQRFHGERAVFLARHHGLDAVAYCAADVSGSAGMKTHLREYLARVKALVDVWILRKGPKFLGEPVEIDLAAVPAP